MNQAADILSHCPKTENENFSDCESDGYRTILYPIVCDDLCEVFKEEKLPLEIKRAVQAKITKLAQDSEKINAHSKIVDVLSRVTPSMMKEAQEKNVDISKMMCYVKSGKNQCLPRYEKLSQDLCKGTSGSLIN